MLLMCCCWWIMAMMAFVLSGVAAVESYSMVLRWGGIKEGCRGWMSACFASL